MDIIIDSNAVLRIMDSHAVVRNRTERAHIAFIQFPWMVTTCKAMVQHYNQDIDIHTVKIQNGSIIVIFYSHTHFPSAPILSLAPGPHFCNFVISKCCTYGNIQWKQGNFLRLAYLLSTRFFGFPTKLLGELIVHSSLLGSRVPWYRCISLFNHLPVKRHLSCFQFGDMMNKTAINILVQIFM